MDDADLEVEIQRELEEEEEALRSAWKSRQREQSSLLYSSVTATFCYLQTVFFGCVLCSHPDSGCG